MCSPCKVPVNVTSVFADLGTADHFTIKVAGGACWSQFEMPLRKHNWFGLIHVEANSVGATGDWDCEFNAVVQRQIDYVLGMDFTFWTPALKPATSVEVSECHEDTEAHYTSIYTGSSPREAGSYYQPRWTQHLGHNVMESTRLLASDMTLVSFCPQYLDAYAHFAIPAAKRPGYYWMIGDRTSLMDPYSFYDFENGWTANHLRTTSRSLLSSGRKIYGATIRSEIIRVPLYGLWFMKTPGVAFCHAAVPFNEVRVSIKTPCPQSVISIDRVTVFNTFQAADGIVYAWSQAIKEHDANVDNSSIGTFIAGGHVPKLSQMHLGLTAAVMTNSDRDGVSERLQIESHIEQVQTHNCVPWKLSGEAPSTNIDLRFTGALKACFFALENRAYPGYRSLYSTMGPTPAPLFDQLIAGRPILLFDGPANEDPVYHAALYYENMLRMSEYSDWYEHFNAFTSCAQASGREERGWHTFLFATSLVNPQPCGHVNASRLASMQLELHATTAAQEFSCRQGRPANWRPVVIAINNAFMVMFGGCTGFMAI